MCTYCQLDVSKFKGKRKGKDTRQRLSFIIDIRCRILIYTNGFRIKINPLGAGTCATGTCWKFISQTIGEIKSKTVFGKFAIQAHGVGGRWNSTFCFAHFKVSDGAFV
jgi:hypothetical protein